MGPPPMPGAAARLTASFFSQHLADELESVRQHVWQRQRIYGAGVGRAAEVDWRCLALRSQGGDGERTDPGGPGMAEFTATPWLKRTPYARSVLRNIPAPLRAVRYMALGPGAVSHEHHDTKYGPRWGVARLHVPIVTNPDALLFLDGQEYCWQPGSFWFGDFSRTHRVQNLGSETRVHLVIDCLVVPSLATRFPETWQDYFRDGDVLLNRPATPLPAEAAAWECEFEVPEPFTDWEEPDGAFLAPDVPLRRATVAAADPDGLLVEYEGLPPVRLVHLADGEFRYAGWTEERTIQPRRHRNEVVLRTRIGRTVRELTVPAKFTA